VLASTLAVSIFLAVGIIGLVIYLILTLRKLQDQSRIFQAMAQEFAEQRTYLTNLLHNNAADTAERITRSSANLRQELADRLAQEFLQVQEHLENQLLRGRKESRYMLHKSTQALEEKFRHLETKTQTQLETIRDKIDERLLLIGREVQSKLDENMQEGFRHFEKVQEHLRAAESNYRRSAWWGVRSTNSIGCSNCPTCAADLAKPPWNACCGSFCRPIFLNYKAAWMASGGWTCW
jgi:DNA anti-recombination protein RmuC